MCLAVPSTASVEDVYEMITEELTGKAHWDKPGAASVQRGKAIGSAVDSFFKREAKEGTRFGGAFLPASRNEHFDLKAGPHSKTGLPGEIKYCQTQRMTPQSPNLMYTKAKDFTDSEYMLAVSGAIHQIAVFFDRTNINDIKWPIFITDTPTQRQNWAAQVTDGGDASGAVIIKAGKNPELEPLTQIIRHEDLSCLWGYIIGPNAIAEAPQERHPYKCKCDAPPWNSWRSLSLHRRTCNVWPFSS